jgi:peptidoglycan/LPS O-acetylase OafA/YrhL
MQGMPPSEKIEPSLHVRSLPLDLLRTIAIFLVFTSHFRIFGGHEWFQTIGNVGWAGVDLFFVLSGFLIASQLFKTFKKTKTISLWDFYLRRGFRIWPNYFFVLILYFCFPFFAERGEPAPLWRFLTFTQNFGLNYREYGAFSHAWSLCVEEQFYLLLPFFILWVAPRLNFRKSILTYVFLLLGGIALRWILWNTWVEPLATPVVQKELSATFFKVIYYPTYCRLDSLAIGVGIAALKQFHHSLWQKIETRADWFLGAGILFLIAAYFVGEDEISFANSVFGYPLLAWGFGCLTVSALAPTGVFSRFQFRVVKWSATLAFSFYLIHKSFIHHTSQWLIGIGVDEKSILYPIVITAVCLLGSLLVYLVIEKPFLAYRDRVLAMRDLTAASRSNRSTE